MDKVVLRWIPEFEEQLKQQSPWYAFECFFRELVDLKEAQVDVLLDKYEIIVEGKYPRESRG